MRRTAKGFSLIELMVTVAVIGVLAAFTYPNYSQYVNRGHRANGQQFLMEMAQRQEQYLIDSRQYGTAAELNVSLPPGVAQDYTLTVTLNVGGARPFFQAVLVPLSSQMANDGRLFVNSRGERWRETNATCDAAILGSCAASSGTAIAWE